MKTNLMVLAGALAVTATAVPSIADQLAGPSDPQPPVRDVARSDMMPRMGTLSRADRIIGADVIDAQGKKLGTVKDLALDLANGRVAEVIVSTGGSFADHHIYAIPPVSFSWDGSKQDLCLNVTREQLKGVPEFSLSQWEHSTEASQITQVYQRYGVEPYFKDDVMAPAKTHNSNEIGGQDTHYYSFNGNNALPRLGYISRASKLLGTTVWSMENEKLARVDNFMVDVPAGRAAEVILGGRGLLSAHGELCAVPPQSFHWNADKTALTLDSTKEALKDSPHFRPTDYEVASQPMQVRDVYVRYHVEPYFTTVGSDNNAQNVRERTDVHLDAVDKMNLEKMNGADLKISDQIHQEIINHENLSLDAKNVKIVTADGFVTLIGTVSSEAEKKQIGDLAAKIVPMGKIDNELHVGGDSTVPFTPPPYY